MNLIDSLQYSRRRAILGSEAALSLLAPVAATGLVMSISDAIGNSKAVRQTKFLNSAFKKIKHAVMVANRDKTVPNIELDTEEKDVLELVFQGLKSGFSSAVTMIAEGLFSFIPFAIEMVVAPMLSIVSMTILEVLPLILSPEGLLAVGLLGAGFYLYKRWSEKNVAGLGAGTAPPFPDVDLTASGGVKSTVPQVQIGPNSALGIRNNNPGNLVYAHQPGALPKNGTFAQFPDQATGLYNMARQIKLNQAKGYTTVDSMVRHWSATDQDAYVASVCRRLGVKPNDQIDLNDEATMTALMEAIIQQENQQNPYSKEQIAEAVHSVLNQTTLVLPASGVVSSPYGHRDQPLEGASTEHMGVDIAGPAGSPVYAAAGGTVEVEKTSSSYGNLIQLKHENMWTRYGHLSKFNVSQGDMVAQGQKIGEMGSTGVSTGSHLHFEVQPFTAKAPVDPASYLPQLTKGSRVASAPVVEPSRDAVAIKNKDRLVTLNH